MGVYRAAIVTENGQNLIAQALANEKPLIFTSAKTSSYSYPVGTDVPALTGLQDVVQSVLPFDSKVLGGNVAQVSVRFDNDGVDQTYRIETIGLYAKIEGGAEILFSVTQATTPDEMPVQSDISPSAYIYNIQHTVQNASQITLTVNPAGTATVQDIMDIETPEFDDSGTVEGISSFPNFLETMKSKMNFFQFFRNLKAGLQFVLHAGQIVNNCVTDNAGLPLSAAQGKVLKDLYTQLYSEKITWCGNITDLSALVSLSQQNKTVYIGYIDWRQTDILPSGSKSGTTICFASDWWIWALSGSKEFFCLTREAKWEKAPYLLSNDLTDFQNKFFINMTNYTFDDLKKVYTGALPKIGFVGYSGPFTPNRQIGYVLCGGSCALLFSVNGDRYRYNAGIGDTAWVKLT